MLNEARLAAVQNRRCQKLCPANLPWQASSPTANSEVDVPLRQSTRQPYRNSTSRALRFCKKLLTEAEVSSFPLQIQDHAYLGFCESSTSISPFPHVLKRVQSSSALRLSALSAVGSSTRVNRNKRVSGLPLICSKACATIARAFPSQLTLQRCSQNSAMSQYTLPSNTVCRYAVVYRSRSTQFKVTRRVTGSWGTNAEKANPDQHMHGASLYVESSN